METLEDSNCHSLSDSFSLYERYMRSFSVIEPNQDTNHLAESRSHEPLIRDNALQNTNVGVDIDASNVDQGDGINKYEHYILNQHYQIEESSQHSDKNVSSLHSPECSLSNCESYIDKSELIDLPVSSEDTKSNNSTVYIPKPVVITSLITMDNSNNAMDSVPLFCDVRPSETVFKLPVTELSFNGTIKHVQKLKPMVDPITVLTSVAANNNNVCISNEETNKEIILDSEKMQSNVEAKSNSTDQYSDVTENGYSRVDDSMDGKSSLDRSLSSAETSFDSGVRSPDMFSEDDDDTLHEPVENFWNFTQKFETEERARVKKIEEVIRGVLPPPSVTMLQTNVTEMLNKYYCFLPAFTNAEPNPKATLKTPTKGVSYIKIPDNEEKELNNKSEDTKDSMDKSNQSIIEMCTENEVKETAWPDILKCKYHNVHYNITNYSEKVELLSMKHSMRYVGAETASSVTVFSDSLPSPSSAGKRKMLRIKLAQGKSPGRRLSHLARRRQAFCNAATISEKTQASTSKMVLIDKNYFPHKKLTYSSDRKCPRTKRTPGRKTPGRKTPGKRTPCKTPKTRSGEGSKKKAMRRLLMDPETLSRTQPNKETFKRALFISPDNRKTIKEVPCTSAPQATLKSRRALFSSPNKTGDTKSQDGTPSDNFMKRKRELFDSGEESRSKIPKSLSFGGDKFDSGSQSFSSSQSFTRRASEVFQQKSMAELNELHKKKLLWAVSEALRVHGWRMGSAGFKEKASALARLTRRLLAIPQHAAKLQHPTLSTSDTLLKIARQYVFAIIQGRTVEDCFQEEQLKLSNEARGKVTGYISEAAYQQLKAKPAASRIKENTCDSISKRDLPRSASKNVLQDINSNSNSSGFAAMERAALFKSNSMPSFNDAAKMRARRQISFDNINLPKR